MVAISIVVPATEAGPLLPLLVSLDAQTLPAEEFEVVVLDRGLSAPERGVVDRAASRRPNVVVVDRSASWLEHLTGDLVLLGAAGRLFPASLERLAAIATQHDVAVVGSRQVRPKAGVDGAHLDDGVVDAASVAHVLDDDLLLVRRSLVRAGAELPQLDAGFAERAAGPGSGEVGMLGSYPGALLPAGSADDLATLWSVRIESVSDRWQDGRYRVEVSGQAVVPAGADATLLTGARPVVLLRAADSQLSVVLPSTGTVDAEGALQATVELDPSRSLLGHPLTAGIWHLDLVLAGAGIRSRPVSLPATDRSVALLPVDGDDEPTVVVVGRTPRQRWLLDVGARHEPVVTAAGAGATVTESHHGSLLEVPLPDLHVATAHPAAGRIALGTLQLPARLDVADGTAVLRAHVSGLFGREVVSAAFGGGPLRPTGLVLVVRGTGEMEVADDVPEAAPPRPRRPAGTTSPKATPPKSPGPAPAPLTLRKVAGRVKRGVKRRVKRWRRDR